MQKFDRKKHMFLVMVPVLLFLQCGYPNTEEEISTDTADKGEMESDERIPRDDNLEEPETGIGCDYPIDCLGDICRDDCNDGAVCGAAVYPEEREYIENYCYPVCDKSYGESECLCDDVCVELDDEENRAVCLATGLIDIPKLSIHLMDVGIVPGSGNIEAISSSKVTAYLGDETLAFSQAYGWFLEGDLFDQGEEYVQKWAAIAMYAPKDSDSAWVLEIYLSERILKEGVFHSSEEIDEKADDEPLVDSGLDDDAGDVETKDDETRQQVNWYVQLLSFEDIDNQGRPDRVYSEGKLSNREENIVEIAKIGEPCPAQDSECEIYQFSFDFEFFAIRSEIDFE